MPRSAAGRGGKSAGLARCPRYDLTCEQRTCGALQPLRAVTLLSHKLCAWSLAVSCALRAQVGQSPTGPEPAIAISALPRPDCDRLAYSRRSSRTRHAAALQAPAQLPPPPPPPPPPAVCRGAAQPSTSPCLFSASFRQLLPCHLRRRGPSSCHLRRRGPAHHISSAPPSPHSHEPGADCGRRGGRRELRRPPAAPQRDGGDHHPGARRVR